MHKKIAPDKWKHFFVGIVMGVLLQLTVTWWLPLHLYWATAVTFFIVVVISYGFELFFKIYGQGALFRYTSV